MNRKYELTNESFKLDGYTLYRIRALRDFSDVKAGDLGGFVRSENNLSRLGNCWVYGDACVYENAKILNNARISGDAWISGEAWVCDNAWIFGDAYVGGGIYICGNVKIDHGVWHQDIILNSKCYILSPTLEMILVG